MKDLHVLCLLLLASCSEARPNDLRPDINFSRCPTLDPLLYTVHLPHPANCNMFLRCDHGTAKPERCPAHLHFNPVLQVCDWPANAGCVKVQNAPPGDTDEWNVDLEPQVEGAQGPREESMPIQELVPEKEVPEEYIPEAWVEQGDVHNEAAEDAAGGDSDSQSGDDQDIFDDIVEYAKNN